MIGENSQPLEEILSGDYNYKIMVSKAACIPGPGAMIRRRAIEIGKGRNPDYLYVTELDF